jgi:hypothetical protein
VAGPAGITGWKLERPNRSADFVQNLIVEATSVKTFAVPPGKHFPQFDYLYASLIGGGYYWEEDTRTRQNSDVMAEIFSALERDCSVKASKGMSELARTPKGESIIQGAIVCEVDDFFANIVIVDHLSCASVYASTSGIDAAGETKHLADQIVRLYVAAFREAQ